MCVGRGPGFEGVALIEASKFAADSASPRASPRGSISWLSQPHKQLQVTRRAARALATRSFRNRKAQCNRWSAKDSDARSAEKGLTVVCSRQTMAQT